ncbi:hypothetical protein PsAD2_01441 [Pseudovibrio axinellae]|uniref:Uncharacterized protein n=1 Tax=Pseudovibrio axinellae TaxID=989403 RepID=A0A166A143_9HYPH|nr:hypothetical protein PsAD2_01441 [Pseudovibrio axinellae]SEQ36151.1 hypothetical protein SAMN05421798_102508 [Pseudovibrio axinellae]
MLVNILTEKAVSSMPHISAFKNTKNSASLENRLFTAPQLTL